MRLNVVAPGNFSHRENSPPGEKVCPTSELPEFARNGAAEVGEDRGNIVTVAIIESARHYRRLFRRFRERNTRTLRGNQLTDCFETSLPSASSPSVSLSSGWLAGWLVGWLEIRRRNSANCTAERVKGRRSLTSREARAKASQFPVSWTHPVRKVLI